MYRLIILFSYPPWSLQPEFSDLVCLHTADTSSSCLCLRLSLFTSSFTGQHWSYHCSYENNVLLTCQTNVDTFWKSFNYPNKLVTKKTLPHRKFICSGTHLKVSLRCLVQVRIRPWTLRICWTIPCRLLKDSETQVSVIFFPYKKSEMEKA